VSIVTELCDLARRYVAVAGQEFAEAAAAGDWECAEAVAGEAARMSAALERQERMMGS
jgi:hypothetical protein